MKNNNTYSISEVAKILGLTLKATRRMVAANQIETIKINNTYRIDKEYFDKNIETIKSNSSSIEFSLFKEEVENKTINDSKKKTDIVNWTDISQFWNNPSASEMTFVDLFCGAGGLSKGLEMAGLHGICGLDWFNEAGMTYKRNFKHPFVNGDIKQQEVKNEFYKTVKEQLGDRKLNVVAGGFPCQGFSMAGNRIVDDPRNSLYLEMLEIVKNLQPDFVICENVKGLRSMLGGEVEKKIIADYKEIGYEMNVTTLCAADYTTPQKRERVIFIGNRIGATNY